MNPTLIDIAILFSFVPVWAGLCWAYEKYSDPRARRRRQRKARYNRRTKELARQRRLLR
jgi:hypothetical protein